jgi:hypothetical protein
VAATYERWQAEQCAQTTGVARRGKMSLFIFIGDIGDGMQNREIWLGG